MSSATEDFSWFLGLLKQRGNFVYLFLLYSMGTSGVLCWTNGYTIGHQFQTDLNQS